MINFLEIREYIDANTTSFKMIGGATEAGQTRAPTTLPAIFVIPASEMAGPNELINAVSQKVDETFVCIIYAKNARQNKKADVTDEMQALKKELRTALVGWQPADTEDIVEFISGETEGFDDHIYIWSDLYKTASRLRKI